MAPIGGLRSVRLAQRARGVLRRVPVLPDLYRELSLVAGTNWDVSAVRLFRQVRPYTMVNRNKLLNVYLLCKEAERRKLAGHFVECGVWRGGCAAVMAYVAKSSEVGRSTWLFDSFEGLPEPTERDGAAAAAYADDHATGSLSSIGRCVGPLEDVQEIMRKLEIDPDRIVIAKGWFQHTIPAAAAEIGDIAVLRLDGDWYESTRIPLVHFYDRVVAGGYVIFDDYDFWEGCRRAVDEFLAERGQPDALRPIGAGGGRYLQKV